MRRLFVIASFALLAQIGTAQIAARHTPQALSDAAMDRVTAGGVTAGDSNGIIKFQGICTYEEWSGHRGRYVVGVIFADVIQHQHQPGIDHS